MRRHLSPGSPGESSFAMAAASSAKRAKTAATGMGTTGLHQSLQDIPSQYGGRGKGTSPAGAVLGTTELLEAICLRLDMCTLLLMQRVSRYWHSAINASVPLQQKLFLAPDWRDTDRTGWERQNPLLQRIFPPFFMRAFPFIPPPVDRGHVHPDWYLDRVENAREDRGEQTGYKQFQHLKVYRTSVHASAVGGKGDGSNHNPFLRAEASWRRMLTSQPPCRHFTAVAVEEFFHEVPDEGPESPVARSYDNGLRMAALYDTVLEHVWHNGVSGFQVVWLNGLPMDGGSPTAAEYFDTWSWELLYHRGMDVRQVIMKEGKVVPDVVVVMDFGSGRVKAGDVPGDDLRKFWRQCGVRKFLRKDVFEGLTIEPWRDSANLGRDDYKDVDDYNGHPLLYHVVEHYGE